MRNLKMMINYIKASLRGTACPELVSGKQSLRMQIGHASLPPASLEIASVTRVCTRSDLRSLLNFVSVIWRNIKLVIRSIFVVLSFAAAAFTLNSCSHSPKTNVKTVNKAKVDSISVIEVIKHKGSKFDQKKLFEICDGYKIKRGDILSWNDRIVILARRSNLWSGEFVYWLNILCEKHELVLFNYPFYTFNRSNCSDVTTTKQWDNIVLTANLVADPKMQQEYLVYHKTQYQKWPEVSQGFCNADFQQLLVFKNSRQLMLIISIPRGESLDRLNPLTMKNNPKVVQWNNMMKKYQEGLPGTKKGETWVFLKPITN